MNTLKTVYKENLSMLTDLYQLTMAYAAWKTDSDKGAASPAENSKTGVFDLYFRLNPFSGGYAIHCGLDSVLDLIENYGFSDDDCKYLASLKGSDGKPLFEEDFLTYLGDTKLSVDIDAIEEGRVVYANEPLLRVQGPI